MRDQELTPESYQIDLAAGFCKRNGMVLQPWTSPDIAQDQDSDASGLRSCFGNGSVMQFSNDEVKTV